MDKIAVGAGYNLESQHLGALNRLPDDLPVLILNRFRPLHHVVIEKTGKRFRIELIALAVDKKTSGQVIRIGLGSSGENQV